METVPFCVVFRFIGQRAAPGANRSFLRRLFFCGLRAVPGANRRQVFGGRCFPTGCTLFQRQNAGCSWGIGVFGCFLLESLEPCEKCYNLVLP